jgi:LysM repeat protein
MYSMGSMPPQHDGEVGSGMKAFFLLVILFVGFLFIASSGLADVDLTPDTPYVSADSGSFAAGPVNNTPGDVVVIQGPASPAPAGQEGLFPVTGEQQNQQPTVCSNPYVVRQGDMLSSIAVLCNTSMADLRAANPEIRNANLIYPGQSLRIPGFAAAAQPTPLPVTGGGPDPAANEAGGGQAPAQGGLLDPSSGPQVIAEPSAGTAPSGEPIIQAGTGVQVRAMGFPSGAQVYIAIGPQAAGYNIVASAVTDSQGNVASRLIVPAPTDGSAPWVVVVATTSDPIIQAASAPFYITAGQ